MLADVCGVGQRLLHCAEDRDKLSATIASKSVGKILDLISEVVNG